MKNRSRTEIMATILKTARPGTAKTKIMFVGFFSYSQLTSYLKLLQETQMIAYDEGDQVYRTTEKGLKFLNMASEIDAMLSTTPQNRAINPCSQDGML